MIEQHHFDAAAQHIDATGVCADHSQVWREGMTQSIAWHLAGLPAGGSRFKACPYYRGTADYEAWQNAWAVGKEVSIRDGLYTPPPCPIYETCRPFGTGRIEVYEPHPGSGAYEWRIFSYELDDDEIIGQSKSMAYSSPEVALYDALKSEIEGKPLAK